MDIDYIVLFSSIRGKFPPTYVESKELKARTDTTDFWYTGSFEERVWRDRAQRAKEE
jgi:hypothetical protein